LEFESRPNTKHTTNHYSEESEMAAEDRKVEKKVKLENLRDALETTRTIMTSFDVRNVV